MASSIASNPEADTPIIRLPRELLTSISKLVPNSDVKNLRLTCTYVSSAVCLRFERVFLSPNPRNIDAFRGVADHPDFRQQVTTIVYDDARLRKHLQIEEEVEYVAISAPAMLIPPEVPNWYGETYNKLCHVLQEYNPREVERSDHLEVARKLKAKLSVVESYELYQQLEEQQKNVIEHNLDAEALEYGLTRFPRLRTVILTPAAHGAPFFPLYKTPMIRSLPEGFIYPIPRGWPMPEFNTDRPTVEAWASDEVKDKWRGFRLLTRVLAQHQRRHQNGPNVVSEFRIEVNGLSMGINGGVFEDADNDEYKNLAAILSQPSMTRIDLALAVRGQDAQRWKAFNSGHLLGCLSNSPNLEHFSVSTDLETHAWQEQRFVPLRNLFPTHQWTQLRHFGLSKFCVLQADLVSVLADLPPTLRSVELSFLLFGPRGCYRDLLNDIRDKLEWRLRPESERPRISLNIPPIHQPGRIFLDVAREVNDFVYGDGENPFGPEDRAANIVFPGVSMERHLFNPEKDRPYANEWNLVDMGFLTRQGNLSGPPNIITISGGRIIQSRTTDGQA